MKTFYKKLIFIYILIICLNYYVGALASDYSTEATCTAATTKTDCIAAADDCRWLPSASDTSGDTTGTCELLKCEGRPKDHCDDDKVCIWSYMNSECVPLWSPSCN